MSRLASILLRTLCGDSLAKVMVRDYDGIPLLLRYVVTLLRLHINYLPTLLPTLNFSTQIMLMLAFDRMLRLEFFDIFIFVCTQPTSKWKRPVFVEHSVVFSTISEQRRDEQRCAADGRDPTASIHVTVCISNPFITGVFLFFHLTWDVNF